MADDPTRWSHSTGEAQEFVERIAATSNRSSGYSGVEEEATVGVKSNVADLDIVVSSGREAQNIRARIMKEREQEQEQEHKRVREEGELE